MKIKHKKNGPDFIPGRILILIKIPACAGMTIADYFTNAPFNIKTAGFRNSKGKFELLGKRADFWTTDDVGDKGKYRYFSVSANAMDKNTYSKKGAMSVRCVMSVNN